MSDENMDLVVLSNCVHQIINPLNAVCGTLDNLVSGEIGEDRRTQRTRAARAQLEHCITLVRNLSFFAQFSINPSEFRDASKKKTCVIPQMLIEAMQFFQESATRKEMRIELLEYEQFKIHADPDLLRQVFMNIFDNGIKYGNRGSLIGVSTRIQRKTGDLLIEIVGESLPIPIDQRELVFNMGFRGDNGRELTASGSGLGLYICRMIVRDVYGGDIHAETRANGNETAFLVRLKEPWV